MVRSLVTDDFRYVIETLSGSSVVFSFAEMMAFHADNPMACTLESSLSATSSGAVTGYVMTDLERTDAGLQLRSSGLRKITITFGSTGTNIAQVVISPILPTEKNPPDIKAIINGPDFDGDFFAIAIGWANSGGSGYIKMNEFMERDGVILSHGTLSSFTSPNAIEVSSVSRRTLIPGHYRIGTTVYYSLENMNYVLGDTLVIEFEIEETL